MTILLVDDHELFLQVFVSAVERQFPNAVFHSAGDGHQAIQLISEHQFDIVVLDIQMPGMDGVTALSKIKKDNPAQRVIMLTQFDEPVLIVHCLRLGACAFLLKTCNLSEVELTLKTVLTEGFYFSPMITSITQKILSGSPDGQVNLDFTPRELQILWLITAGEASKDIAKKLNLSVLTVDTYRKTLMQKTNSRNAAELVSFGFRTGLVSS